MSTLQLKALFSKTIVCIIIIKLLTILLWIPQLIETSTIPFIEHFIENKRNPWMYFESLDDRDIFPYPAGLLYILSFFLFPIEIFSIDHIYIKSFLIQLPTLIADIIIFYLLINKFPGKEKYVTLLYFCSPIVFVASYIYSGHDLIAVALLLLAVHFLTKNEIIKSAIVLGIGLSIKSPVIFALPLLLIFILKSNKKIEVAKYLFISVSIFLVITSPFIVSSSYQALVLANQGQLKVLDFYFSIGNLKVYIAPLLLGLLYLQFLMFKKVNQDLLYTFLGIIYFAFVVLIPPMPNWYVWPFVFATIYFIDVNKKSKYLYIALSLAHFSYFVIFPSDIFDGNINSTNFFLIENLLFTILEGMLLFTIWIFYKYGVQSNSLYKFNTKPFTIGIAGDSGVGKTTLTGGLNRIFGRERVLIVEGDGYHKWERGDGKWSEFTHLNPKANNLHQQAETIECLKQGNATRQVEYDHSTGKFTSPKKIDPNDFIVMCGLHPLYLPKTRKAMDLKIYVDTDEKLRRHWKIIRDCRERGYSLEKVLQQIESRVEDANKYIYPQKKFADLVIKQFVAEPFEVGNPDEQLHIRLKVTCDASLYLEKLLNCLDENKVHYSHDYDVDLKNQLIVLTHPIDNAIVEEISRKCIDNLYELTMGSEVQWGKEYESFIQLMMLISISEKRKAGLSNEV